MKEKEINTKKGKKMIKEIIFENDEVSIKKNVDKNGFEININETKCSSEDIKKWKELILQNHFNYSTRQNIYYKKIDNDAKSFIKEFASNISKKKDDFVISREELETAKLVIPKEQYKATLQLLQGEEKEHYIKIIKNLSEKVNSHSLFSSDDNNEHPLILHYFIGNTDIYISEIDKITKEGFGYTILNGDLQNSEWGYQQIDEITSISGIELDYYVTEEQTIEQKVNQDYPNNFQNKNTAQNTISNLSPEDKEYIPYNQIKNIDFVELSKSKEEIDSSRKATDFVMAKLENAGIEVIQDKETFDEILTREIVLQKAHQNITSEEVHSYFKFENKEIEKYNNTLDNWEQNKNNPRKLIVIGSIPPVMKAIGIADIPIEIENSVISKVLRDEPIYPDEKQGHKLNLEDIREIPTLLADPIMIFKSNTRSDSFVFFTERKDTKNRSIIIPLAVQKKIGRISINQVTSMYGRNNEIEFVYDNVKNKKLIYVDTRRALEWEKLVLTNDFDKKINLDGGLESQVQFLRQRLTKQQGFTDNILTKERLVNFISSRQLMTQNGTVYGFAHEGKIYLNPDIADSNVAVHEYTHLWDKYNQNTNPELWQKGKDVFQKTTLWNEVKEDPNYADIADNDDLVLSECHARICGDIAQKVLEKIAERDGEIAKDAVIDWDKETWEYLIDNFRDEIPILSHVAEFIATPMKDLLAGRDINIDKKEIEKDSIIKEKQKIELAKENLKTIDINRDNLEQGFITKEYSDAIEKFQKHDLEEYLKNGIKPVEVLQSASKNILTEKEFVNNSLQNNHSQTSISSQNVIEISGNEIQEATTSKTIKQIKEIRKQCFEILEKDISQIRAEERKILSQYEGAGGLYEKDSSVNGILNEFYTPESIVNKVWEIVDNYSPNAKTVLEPTSGIGRFANNRQNNTFTMYETDNISSKINKILHPDSIVINEPYQKQFFDDGDRFLRKDYVQPEYDVVIGNPPYGIYNDKYKGLGEGKEFNRYEEYFISKGLDALKKDNGNDKSILAMVVPSGFMNTGLDKQKQIIATKGILLDAWRLPEKAFSTTDVGTDIILMRKYKDIEKNNSLTIKESAEIISNGKFFEYNPDRILGEEQTRINRFGKSEKYIKIHENMTIEDELSKITESIAKQKQKQDEFQKNQVENLTEIESDKIEINEPLPTTDIKTEKKKVMSMEEFSRMYHRDFDKEEYPIYKATNWEGIIEYIKLGEESKNYLKTSKKYVEINENEWQHKTLFCSGDIYKKIEEQKQIIATMQNDDLKKKIEKNIQLLEDSKNKKIPIDNIHIGALTTLAEEFKIVKKHENDDEEELNLQEGFILWATGKPIDEYSRYSIDFVTANISKEDFPTNVSWWDVVNYIDKVAIIAQRTSESSYRSQEENEELRKQRAIEAEQKRITRADTANKLFDKYIHEGLNKEDTERFENEYNRRFNSFVAPDYLKLPLYVDGMSPTKGDSPFRLYQQQLKGAAFTSYKGNGIIAYDVGVGKTATGIVSTIIQLQSERCKRPILLVPNRVYEKWYSDIKELFPNIKINDLFNLNKKAVASYKDENDAHRLKIPNNSLTLCTYEALNNITFRNETCENELFFDFEKLIGSSENKKDRANIIKSISSVIGTASSVKDSNYYFFENCGFDNIIVDEAHNFRNLWTTPRSDNSREANEYKGIPTGKPSKRALKLYAATQYIQKKSNNRNVFMLTATPFDNSPLEVYSMLSYVGRQRLIDSGIYSLRDFINQFAETKLELSVSEDNEVKYKQVMKSWKELPALQNLLSEFIDKVDGEEAGIFRPNKNTKKIELDCSPLQQKIINTEIKRMDIKTDKDTGKSTGNTLKAMNNMRIALVSPALLHKSDYIGTDIVLPDVKDMVESSPKLKFVCDTIIELYKDNPEKGQYMYMPLGKSAHPFVKEYLVSKGIPTEAIEIINGEINSDVKKQIIIQNNFNNKDHKLKILIGGENTKEGIDLNGNTFVMYNMSLGWNPSDRTQSEGRIWRQGNEQGVVNCVYPVMYDCIDSKLLQKHDEKGSRINALWTYKGNSVEAEDSINPEELKFELIKDPSKKAELILAEETKDITAEISNIKLKLSTIDEIVERTKSINQQLALYIRNESRLQSNIDEIKKTEKEIPNYLKMELKEAKRLLTNVKLQKENIDAKLNHLNIHTEDEISQYISNLNMKKHSLEEDKEEMRKRLPEMIEEFKIQVAEKKILSHPSEEQRLELVKQINSEIIPFKKILPKLKKNRLEKYVAEKLKTGEMDENLSKIVLRNGYDNWTKWREGELTDNEYMNLNKVNQNINSNENKKEEKLEKSLKQEFIRNVADKDIQQFELFSLEDIQECKTDAEKIKFIDDTSITERQLEEIKQKQLEIINPVINGEKTGLWNVFNTFKETGLLDIKGSQIELKNNNITSNGWKQLHAVMDIYRDKMFETFRYVMINRETGKITDQLSINSQMPGITLAELNDDTLKQVITRAEQTDSLIACVHNHPSGNIQPSKFDISTTETLFKRLNSSSGNVERFVGHIILDHNSFSIINKDNTCNYITDKITNVDKFVKENNPSWTKHEIKSFGDLVNVAKSINDINNWNDNYIPLVFVNGKQIHGVQLFDPKFFDNSSDEIKKELQTSCLTVGSTMAFPIITNKYLEKNTLEEQEKLESNIVNHIKNNAFTDCSIGNVSVCEKYNLIPEMIVKDVSIEELKNRTKLHSTWNLTVNPNLFRQELKKNENAVMGR